MDDQEARLAEIIRLAKQAASGGVILRARPRFSPGLVARARLHEPLLRRAFAVGFWNLPLWLTNPEVEEDEHYGRAEWEDLVESYERMGLIFRKTPPPLSSPELRLDHLLGLLEGGGSDPDLDGGKRILKGGVDPVGGDLPGGGDGQHGGGGKRPFNLPALLLKKLQALLNRQLRHFSNLLNRIRRGWPW
ncbi:MAG: hypothetical protein CML46_04340 [Rhodobacteraceae bacterium]|nr:hypothetical protein [Paracoccaceae bacterium]MBR26170.1 hypothetical protein [Paracoccaceae bacterium]